MTAKKDNLVSRPPVVVILGHVDHGKSSILEAIKDLKITAKESGGITQHIGAYEVDHQGKKITFIDTPGHEAFSAMRSRGAKVADIAILVVAADEGIKPQTKEAILHIRKSQIPMIVAINKMDKPTADPEKVKRELSTNDVSVESMGGKVPCVEVSAQNKSGITDLLELILLVAEMEDFKGDISKPAEGVVIESYLDSFRGPTTTLVLQNGILKKGDIVASSSVVGKVKSLENFQGESIKEALPSMPVIVLGFEKVPGVGDKIKVCSDIESAQKEMKPHGIVPEVLDIEEGVKVLNLILKVDVLGSLEALEEILREIPQEKVVLRILKGEVGDINESDIKLANSAKAVIVGFRVKVTPIAKSVAQREKIKVKTFEVIYELAQAVRQALEKNIESEVVVVELGKAEVVAIFRTEKKRQILGVKVIDGEIRQGALLKVLRNEEEVGQGKIISLKKEQKDVGQMAKGSSCGILYQGDCRVEERDILEAYIKEHRKAEI